MRNLSYLACPYTQGSTPETTALRKWQILQERHQKANIVAGLLFERGYYIYSPISHGPVLEPHMAPEVADNWQRWMDHCYAMLEHCEEVFILRIRGWEKSLGIQAETQYAREHGLPIYFVDLVVEDIVEGIPEYTINIIASDD